MAHALLTNKGHTLVNGLFRPRNDDASFHDVPHGRCGRRFTLENNIPRIVPFGDNANELVAFHHYQRSNVFFSHFRDGIEDRSIRVNRPSVPALLIKQLSHRSHLGPPSDTSPGKIFDNNQSNFHRRNFVMSSDRDASASGQLTPTQWKLLMLFGSFSPRRLGWRSPRSFLRESYSGLRDGIDRCVRSHSSCYGWRTHHFKACFHKARSHQCPHQEDRREQAYDGEETSVAWTLAAASGRLFISVHDPHP
jgi:hypothetical protein